MRNRFVFIALVLAFVGPGCMYHGGYPNGYYNGYYGGNPSIVQPPQWGAPVGPGSQPYYTPGAPTFQPGSPTPLNGGPPSSDPLNSPGGTTSPSNWNTPGTYDNGSGNSAPKFDPSTPGKSVPNPDDDPSTNNSPTSQRPGLTPTSSSNSRLRSQEELESPFRQDETNRQQRSFENENVVEADGGYEQPLVRPTSGSDDDNEVQQANRVVRTSEGTSRPYGHDAQFQVIKGVVEYDDSSKAWVIMYDDNPSPKDRLGGVLTLAKHPSLDRLRDQDKVRIEGSFDESERDARGVPLYVITKLKKQ